MRRKPGSSEQHSRLRYGGCGQSKPANKQQYGEQEVGKQQLGVQRAGKQWHCGQVSGKPGADQQQPCKHKPEADKQCCGQKVNSQQWQGEEEDGKCWQNERRHEKQWWNEQKYDKQWQNEKKVDKQWWSEQRDDKQWRNKQREDKRKRNEQREDKHWRNEQRDDKQWQNKQRDNKQWWDEQRGDKQWRNEQRDGKHSRNDQRDDKQRKDVRGKDKQGTCKRWHGLQDDKKWRDYMSSYEQREYKQRTGKQWRSEKGRSEQWRNEEHEQQVLSEKVDGKERRGEFKRRTEHDGLRCVEKNCIKREQAGIRRDISLSRYSRLGNNRERLHYASALLSRNLRQMLTMDPTDVVLDLLKHEKQLQSLLDDEQSKDNDLELLLEILANVYDTHMKENLIKILAIFQKTAFLQKSLPRYIIQLPLKSRNAGTEKKIENVLLFFDQLLKRFPDICTEIPLDSLLVASMNIEVSEESRLSQQVQDLIAVRQRIIEKKSRLQDARRKNNHPDEPKPPDDFRGLSVHPNADDFKANNEVFLRKNIVQGKYQNVDHYLDVQFRLLREDFIGPLREGVNEISQSVGRSERIQNLRVYRDVSIVGKVYTISGVVHCIRFNSEYLRRVNWESSKRLIFGSFLCMSKDNFSTFLFATITERNANDLKKGYLQVRFLEELPEDLQAEDRFQMVESPGYYESYCHNLQGLQELSEDKMPFIRYLVNCETDVHVPSYLEVESVQADGEMSHEVFFYDLEGTLKAKVDAKAVPVLDIASWPTITDVELNQSQLQAIQAALTKEFVVIQGPPGTGKTYVGLRIVQALLKNERYWSTEQASDGHMRHRGLAEFESQHSRSQMLVVCYTNHALDQFLEGILHFQTSGIVRVGGRSSSQSLQNHNLTSQVRRTAAWYEEHREIQEITSKIETIRGHLSRCNTQILKLEDLEDVIPENEYEQFLAYLSVAEKMRVQILDAWINMHPLPFLGLQDSSRTQELLNDEYSTSEGDKLKGCKQEDNSGQKKENKNQEISKEPDTIDIVQDAERLRREREVDDDMSTTGVPESVKIVNMGLPADYIKIRDLQVQAAELNPALLSHQRNQGLWTLDQTTRLHLYHDWVQQYQGSLMNKLQQLYECYEPACRRFKEVKDAQDEKILRHATVIGMTTTGAAKYRNVLQKIQPKIVVVEEAAEVLEAHIITSLSKGAQHLILIGDHKQLKPNPSVYTLAKQYNLEVSLFERMVRNGMKCYTLDTQHRMRPEIAQLMKHIYDDLKNHVSVERFENVQGVSKNLFFIDHQHAEKRDEELRSHSNEHEASFIVALCRYLLRQGYDSSKITVLTMYTGQLLELKRLMPKSEFAGVRVCSVDNFQGEENEIILLSLVRSNNEHNIGFLGISNRICVALSRARIGFYCIGNISMLAGKSELWAKISADLQKQNSLGPALPIYCRNHLNTKIKAGCAQDFKKAPDGGCSLPCDFRLNCGHKCEMFCHPVDTKHLKYECEKLCRKEVCSLEHRCPKRCHYGSSCGPCREPVTKTLNKCGHKHLMPCSTDAGTFKCTSPCERRLPCYHRCQSQCGIICSSVKCKEMVEKTLNCGHKHTVECSKAVKYCKCNVPCETILECGHQCKGNCHDCKQGRFHVACKHPCGRTLICSHPCKELCSKDCSPCERECENQCMHSTCRRKCGEPCTPCKKPCGWQCRHKKCTNACSEMCNRGPCNVQCRRRLQCNKGHRCIGLCGEKCPRLCRICDKKELTENFFGTESEPRARFIELLDCEHVFEVTAFDQWMTGQNTMTVQLKQCPKCKIPIRNSWRYGNIIKQITRDIQAVHEKIKQKDADFKTKVTNLRKKVLKLVKKYPLMLGKGLWRSDSDEEYESESAEDSDEEYESESGEDLDKDYEDYPAKYYMESKSDKYSVYCASRHLLDQLNSCTRNELTTVENQIQLLSCIYEIKSKFLTLKRRNIPLSRLNDLEKTIITSKLTTQQTNDLIEEIARVTLIFKLKNLQQDINDTHTSIPDKTQTLLDAISDVLSSERRVELKERDHIHETLDKIIDDLGFEIITLEEKVQIAKAIVLTEGHWLKCHNGHFYVVGECSETMEKGKCPECQVMIGGTQHKVVKESKLAPEMDGAEKATSSDQGILENYEQEASS